MADEKLSPKQEQAAVLDAQGHSREEIAKVIGVSSRTVATYRSLPTYQARRDELAERHTGELESSLVALREKILVGAQQAVDALIGVLSSAEDDSDVVKAAEVLLKHAGLGADSSSAQQGPQVGVVVVRDERSAPEPYIEGREVT